MATYLKGTPTAARHRSLGLLDVASSFPCDGSGGIGAQGIVDTWRGFSLKQTQGRRIQHDPHAYKIDRGRLARHISYGAPDPLLTHRSVSSRRPDQSAVSLSAVPPPRRPPPPRAPGGRPPEQSAGGPDGPAATPPMQIAQPLPFPQHHPSNLPTNMHPYTDCRHRPPPPQRAVGLPTDTHRRQPWPAPPPPPQAAAATATNAPAGRP